MIMLGDSTKAALSILILTAVHPSTFSPTSCLRDHFYGTYRDGNTTFSFLKFPGNSSCVSNEVPSLPHVVHFQEVPSHPHHFVWLEEEAIEDSVIQSNKSGLDSLLDKLVAEWSVHPQALVSNTGQAVFSKSQNPYTLHYRGETGKAALLSVAPDNARIIDTLLPPYWKSTLLPTSPVNYQPVPPSAVEHIKQVLANLRFDPIVASVVKSISLAPIKSDVRFLTGEDEISGIMSRHSFTEGALTAAQWIKESIEATGAKCQLRPFLVGFAPNVICRYNAIKETSATVLFSAHYDSRGSFGSTRAPGADDDASGTAAILAVARAIGHQSVKFHSNVELVTFAGEEQGLLGSKAYAREMRAAGANITLMIQADMLAYRVPDEPLQLGLAEDIGTPEATQLVANVSAIYSPELHVGFSVGCCSDHQSFHEQGFPATELFERVGPIADPMYHNSGDLSNREGYDFDQLYSIAKVQVATLLHTAGFELSA